MQIEAGKRYIRRDGKISGVLVVADRYIERFFDPLNRFAYCSNGRHRCWVNKEESELDLIEELTCNGSKQMKEYRTKDGRAVVFFTRNHPGFYCLVGYVKNQCDVHQWSLDGAIAGNSDGKLNNLCLVEISPYDDFKIDEPVLAWNCDDDEPRERAHFAGVDSSGLPTTWDDGRTSWSMPRGKRTQRTTWDFCVKASEEKECK